MTMLIAHISDLHIFAEAKETSLVRDDAERAARAVIADIAALPVRLDAVVISGDLADGGSERDYALLREILAPMTTPLVVVPGNHDKRPTMRAAFAGVVPFGAGPYLHYETEIGGLRFIALDTLFDGHVAGKLCPERQDFAREAMSRKREEPLVLTMHHPPFDSGMVALDDNALVEGRALIAELVGMRKAPTRVLCGHIHRPYQALWLGALAAVGGSPAFQVGLELTGAHEEPGLVDEPYAYFIHRIEPHGDGAVHTRYVAL
jgi:Icc protein